MNQLSIIFSFLTVGAVTALIHFSVFAGLLNIFHFDYRVAITLAYFLAVTFHFNANRYFTFKNTDETIGQQLPRYAVMVFINYLITLLTISTGIEMLGFSPYTSNMLAIGMTLISGYLLLRFWVFLKV